MANPSTPFGLRPVRHISGAPWNGAIQKVWVDSNYATALFVGDPVTWATQLDEASALARYRPVITHAGTAGLVINGVIVGFAPDPDNLTYTYRPASTNRWAYIVHATPDIVFQIRDNGDGTPAVDWPGRNALMEAGGGGSTVTGLSSFALQAVTPAATQNYTLHMLGTSDIEDNEMDDYAIWDVLINTSRNTTGDYLGEVGA